MKKILSGSASAVLFLFFACNDSGSNTNGAKTDSSAMSGNNTSSEKTAKEQSNKNMRAVYDGIEKGDLSAMDSFVADDIYDHNGPMGPVKGRDSVKKMLSDVHNHIADIKMDIIAQGEDGDYHMTLVKMTGKTKDGMMGMPANTNFTDTSVDVVRIANGKAVEHWSFEMPRMHQHMSPKDAKGKK